MVEAETEIIASSSKEKPSLEKIFKPSLELLTELECMKNGALRKRAAQLGIHEDILEAADDADDVKGALIELISAHRLAAPEHSLLTELSGMKNGALRKQAVQLGINEDILEEADDANDPKAAFIELILAHVAAAHEHSVSSGLAPYHSSVTRSQQENSTPRSDAPPGAVQEGNPVSSSSKQDNLRLCLQNTFLHVVDVDSEIQRERTISRSRSDSSLSSSFGQTKSTEIAMVGGPEHLVFGTPRNCSSSSSIGSQQQEPRPRSDPLKSLRQGRKHPDASHAADLHPQGGEGYPAATQISHVQRLNPGRSESSLSGSCSSDLTPDSKADRREARVAQFQLGPSPRSIPQLGSTQMRKPPSGDGVSLQACNHSSPSKEPTPPFSSRVPTWSAGADLHHVGRCRPCAWMWRIEGCSNGANCDFCHMCSQESLSNAVAVRRAAQRRKARDHRR